MKKTLTALVIICLILNTFTLPHADGSEQYIPSDINDHWAEKDINVLLYSDIMKGYHGMVSPNEKITRGQFTALIARTLSLTSSRGQIYSDIPDSHVFFGEIGAATDAGIVNGVGGGAFLPDNLITREEIMLIISRCTDSLSVKTDFKDISSGYPYIKELGEAVASGIINGYNDGTFRPKSIATRAECAAMLVRLLKTGEDLLESDINSLASEYIRNDLENISDNLDITSGRAFNEVNMKLKAQKLISDLSAVVKKIPIKTSHIKTEISGSIARAVYEGDITYITTTLSGTRNKTYKAVYEIDIMASNGELKVFNCNMSLGKNQRINLTWEVYSNPPDYAPHGVNVISPSSFQISASELGVESSPLDGNIKFYNSLTRKYMNYAHENGYEVWPIYKTDFSLKTSDRLLTNPDIRQKSIEYLIKYSLKYLTDGVNIDFENIYERNRHLLSRHARELSIMLHELGLIVSVDITRKEPTSANWSMCYDRDLLSQSTDYVMLMAYDEYYASSKSAGSVASLDWTEESIKRTLGEVTSDKLILGIPFYMRYFELTGNKVTSSKAISMSTAYDMINSNNVTYTYMENDRQYKISWKNGSKTCVFWLENSDTVKDRVMLANKYSLAGIGSWRRGLEIKKIWNVISENL